MNYQMRRTANENHELKPHRFPAGDRVRLNGPRHYTNAAGGVYDIVELLPERDGELQYRVKSSLEGHHRVVGEGELKKA
jgi:hypothetical protein